jgi:hypothetical protein
VNWFQDGAALIWRRGRRRWWWWWRVVEALEAGGWKKEALKVVCAELRMNFFVTNGGPNLFERN